MIIVEGAREHNLKNINVQIPRGEMSVITGLSGSGKSSLAFDVIYAESNRRFMESMSMHARMLTGGATKPDVDKISNLSPAIAIDQKSVGRSVRSTVGTMTEIYDHLRVLYASVGVPHCPETGRPLNRKSARQIVDEITTLKDGAKVMILAPTDEWDGGTPVITTRIQSEGYARVRFNQKIIPTSEAVLIADKDVQIYPDIIIDSLTFEEEDPDPERLMDSVESAMKVSGGSVIIVIDEREERYTRDYYCPESGFRLAECTPRHFSFNNPDGACPACDGLGIANEIDPELLIPNKSLSLQEGAVHLWGRAIGSDGKMDASMKELAQLAERYRFSLATPVEKLSPVHLAIILYGAPEEKRAKETLPAFDGVIARIEKRYREARSDTARSDIEKYMISRTCPTCEGRRLARVFLLVAVAGETIDYFTEAPFAVLIERLDALMATDALSKAQQTLVAPLVNEMRLRAQALVDVGVGYLTLARGSDTISGGEAQRIRLAVQIKSDLTGVVYVLDEPTTGLHSADTEKLITTMQALRDVGNTLIVVEHDAEVMRRSSWIVDMGPGAGELGGEVVYAGTYEAMLAAGTSTALFLDGKERVSDKKKVRPGNGKNLTIKGATHNNLKDVTVSFPLGLMIAVCGVSGSGKSTLMHDILAPELARKFHRSRQPSGEHEKITGMQNLKKVIMVDQAPIGRTPRSNAATYTGVFTHIRDVFTATEMAQEKKLTPSHFSFNMRGGRCATCQGDGALKVEMHLLPDAYIDCEACHGTRYNDKIRSVLYNGVSIADVLDMSVAYAKVFFKNHKLIYEKLNAMEEVGLGYLRLGQSATHLSGGEAQRIKLATELARKQTGNTMYILDEPTAGLHFSDAKRLLGILDRLVDKGNTVIVIEHNTDVIAHADWVVELGPVGGADGGRVVFEGLVKDLKKKAKTATARYL